MWTNSDREIATSVSDPIHHQSDFRFVRPTAHAPKARA